MIYKTATEDREGAAMTCDGSLLRRRAAATGMLCRRQRTDEIRRTSRDWWGRTSSFSCL